MTSPTSREDLAAVMMSRICDRAKELSEQGMKADAFGVAVGAVLIAQLVKSQERIDRLEGDIQLLTELLASLEEKQ